MSQRVIIVAAPWARTDYPSVQAGVIKSFLSSHSIPCEVFLANMQLARLIGDELYLKVANYLHPLLSEAFWAELISQNSIAACQLEAFCTECGELDIKEVETVRRGIDDYLPFYLGARDWARYDFVGFTCTFNQVCASLVLARHIREVNSRARIVFGGFSLSGQMGRHLLDEHGCIDAVISGPGEEALLGFIQSETFGGKAFLEGREVKYSACRPDYAEYQAEISTDHLKKDVTLLLSASSGCNYGKCAFCSQNTQDTYHLLDKKSVLDAIKEIRNSNPACRIEFTDTSFPLSWIDDEWIAEVSHDTGAFYAQVRPPLNPNTAFRAKRAGFEGFQVGIEIFHSGISKKMQKPNDLITNVFSLKSAYENDLDIWYNLILDFPSVTNAELDEMRETIPLLYHLSPPESLIPFQLQYGSDVYKNPEKYGVTNLVPHRYHQVFEELGLGKALFPFYFEFSQRSVLDMERLFGIHDLCKQWYKAYDPVFPALAFRYVQSGVMIIDRRVSLKEFHLWGAESEVLLKCLEPRRLHEIQSLSSGDRSCMLACENLMKKGLLLFDSDRFLSLPVELKQHSLRKPEMLNSFFSRS